jgi:hypothetical protein
LLLSISLEDFRTQFEHYQLRSIVSFPPMLHAIYHERIPLDFEKHSVISDAKPIRRREVVQPLHITHQVVSHLRDPCLNAGRILHRQIVEVAPSLRFVFNVVAHNLVAPMSRHSLLRLAMPRRGLEPLRITPPAPKTGASANSATPAWITILAYGLTVLRESELFPALY